MAIIKVTNTGSGFSGSAGDIYYKVVNGKQIFCSKPTSYKLSDDPVSVRNRGNISILSPIASVVTKTSFFREIWKKAQLKGVGPFHKFLSFNHPGKTTGDLSVIKLTPVSEFEVSVKSFGFIEKNLQVTLNPFSETLGINLLREPFILLNGFLIEWIDKTKFKRDDVIPLQNIIADINVDAEITFTFPFVEIPEGSYELLLMVTTLNSTEQPVRHSNTIYLKKTL